MRTIDADALEGVLELIPAADIKNIDGQAYVLVRLSQVFNVIKNAPPIEPERKKGKWILVTDNNGQHFVCDECGEWKYYQKQNFCGNCGIKMEEGEHE